MSFFVSCLLLAGIPGISSTLIYSRRDLSSSSTISITNTREHSSPLTSTKLNRILVLFTYLFDCSCWLFASSLRFLINVVCTISYSSTYYCLCFRRYIVIYLWSGNAVDVTAAIRKRSTTTEKPKEFHLHFSCRSFGEKLFMLE